MPSLVAVTGATGFIGRHVVESLLNHGNEVRALTRKSQPTENGVTWITGDLANTNALEQLVKDADTVIHCAGEVRGNCYEVFEVTNVNGTENLLHAVNMQKSSPRLLMISSLAAREPHLSWYAKSKFQGERVLINNSKKLYWTILRPTAVYGPGDKELMPLFKSTKKGVLPVTGAPQSKFGLIYVEDLIQAIMTWLQSDNTNEKIYELDDGTDGGYDRYKIKDIASQVWGRKVFILSVPVAMVKIIAGVNLVLSRVFNYMPMLTPGKLRELNHHDWVCNNSHFTKDTGWKPKTELKLGLEKAILS